MTPFHTNTLQATSFGIVPNFWYINSRSVIIYNYKHTKRKVSQSIQVEIITSLPKSCRCTPVSHQKPLRFLKNIAVTMPCLMETKYDSIPQEHTQAISFGLVTNFWQRNSRNDIIQSDMPTKGKASQPYRSKSLQLYRMMSVYPFSSS